MTMNQSNASAPAPRLAFWDLVRGLGILSIVMGHSCHVVIPYVYTYHLAVFFFVSGFLYQESRYGMDPYGHVGARLKSAWPKYVGYMGFYVLLHNLFQQTGINPPGAAYSRSQMLYALANLITFQGVEPMGGTMWFVPVWILSCAVFGGIVWFGLRFFPDTVFRRALVLTGISCLFGLAGCFFLLRGMPLSYQLHLVFLVQPFFAAGWLLRRLPDYRKLLRWYGALPCAALLAWVVKTYRLYIDLGVGRIGNGWQYFLVAFPGIYCCMYLASLLDRLSGCKSFLLRSLHRLIALWGRYSFDIMALHFFIFKCIDLAYGRTIKDPLEVYSGFPQAYSSVLWPVYAVLGTTVPAVLACGAARLKKRLAARPG